MPSLPRVATLAPLASSRRRPPAHGGSGCPVRTARVLWPRPRIGPGTARCTPTRTGRRPGEVSSGPAQPTPAGHLAGHHSLPATRRGWVRYGEMRPGGVAAGRPRPPSRVRRWTARCARVSRRHARPRAHLSYLRAHQSLPPSGRSTRPLESPAEREARSRVIGTTNTPDGSPGDD